MTKKVRIIGLPRRGDPPAQRQLWLGGVFTVVDVAEDEKSDSYVWLNRDEVIQHMEDIGDPTYAEFFRKLALTPGGRFAPGLLVEKEVCEIVNE